MAEFLDDFQEVNHTGGQIKIHIKNEGERKYYSFSILHSNPNAASFFAVNCLVPQGIPVSPRFLTEIGDSFIIPVFIASDKEGFFGRSCPECEHYFRTKSAPTDRPSICPYCRYTGYTVEFLTKAHINYVKSYVEIFVNAFEQGNDVTIDMDKLSEQLEVNRPPLYYTEEKQQTQFKCIKCGVVTDIIGQYGFCPFCGYRNTNPVLEQHLNHLLEKVNNPRYTEDQRNLRDAEWREIVKQCVSYFEGFGRDFIYQLLEIPAAPSRKEAIKNISFHNPIQASIKLKEYFDIDLLVGIGEDEQEFIRKRYLRRHIYEHNSGIADQDYISKSKDNIKLGQLVRERSSNVITLIELTRKMAINFDKCFDSIWGSD